MNADPARDTPADEPASPALTQVLTRETWRNERLLNGFRVAIWAAVGAITGGAEFVSSGSVSPGALLALVWAFVAAVSGATWLKRWYRPWASVLLVTMDITVLALCMHAGHRYLLVHDPRLVPAQLHASGVVLMALLATNMLRFSRALSLWSVAYGAVAYAVMLAVNDAVNVLTWAELTVMALLGLMLAHSARKLGTIVRQAVERDSLIRFLPAPVVDRISRDPGAVNLEGEAQEITALFADLRDFTGLAERLSPRSVVQLLNEFFTEMAREITRRGGVLMQYTGDNIYAVFAEQEGGDHPRRALKCALAMLQCQDALNARRVARGEPPLGLGIGVHTGPVIAGSIGSPELLGYAYVGDTVNTASRIERMTRTLGRPLLVSGTTFQRAGGTARFFAEAMPPLELRGKSERHALWAVSARSA